MNTKIRSALFALVMLTSGAGVWWLYGVSVIRGFNGNMEASGQFGDMFGALSCLFSILGFLAVIYTIIQNNADKKLSDLRSSYESVLKALEYQIKVTDPIKNPSQQKRLHQDLLFYSNELRTLLTKTEPNFKSLERTILEEFSKLEGMNTADILSGMLGIKEGLAAWGIDSSSKIQELITRIDIREFLYSLYKVELDRTIDPEGFSVWGGLLFKQGFTEKTKAHVIKGIRSSKEWIQKNEGKIG